MEEGNIPSTETGSCYFRKATLNLTNQLRLYVEPPFKNKGVQGTLDDLVKYMPSPLDGFTAVTGLPIQTTRKRT